MKAKDQNGRVVEVEVVGHDVVRDTLWRCYRANGKTGEGARIYDNVMGGTGPAHRLTVPSCACDTGFLPGARIAEDSEAEVILESCEVCERYRGDEDAAEAFVGALNRDVGEEHFALLTCEPEAPEEDDDEDDDEEDEEQENEEDDIYYAIGLANDDEDEVKALSPVEFQAQCKMLKIEISPNTKTSAAPAATPGKVIGNGTGTPAKTS
jgi:hypothetical protein